MKVKNCPCYNNEHCSAHMTSCNAIGIMDCIVKRYLCWSDSVINQLHEKQGTISEYKESFDRPDGWRDQWDTDYIGTQEI